MKPGWFNSRWVPFSGGINRNNYVLDSSRLFSSSWLLNQAWFIRVNNIGLVESIAVDL
jgi:hypothetical protein